jgi:hypothetical protein
MCGYRLTTVEVWPIAAHAQGFRLLSGDGPWTPKDATASDWSQHEVAEDLLSAHRDDAGLTALDATAVLHSTSWRPLLDRPWEVFTYIAAVDAGEDVIDRWPGARPISRRLLEAVGKPYVHDSTEPPLVRWIDVAAHGLRHYRLLTNPGCDAYNATTAADLAALPGRDGQSWWDVHLDGLKGQLAGLYRPEPGWAEGLLVGASSEEHHAA